VAGMVSPSWFIVIVGPWTPSCCSQSSYVSGAVQQLHYPAQEAEESVLGDGPKLSSLTCSEPSTR